MGTDEYDADPETDGPGGVDWGDVYEYPPVEDDE